MREEREEGRGKREDGSGKMEVGSGKMEVGRGKMGVCQSEFIEDGRKDGRGKMDKKFKILKIEIDIYKEK